MASQLVSGESHKAERQARHAGEPAKKDRRFEHTLSRRDVLAGFRSKARNAVLRVCIVSALILRRGEAGAGEFRTYIQACTSIWPSFSKNDSQERPNELFHWARAQHSRQCSIQVSIAITRSNSRNIDTPPRKLDTASSDTREYSLHLCRGNLHQNVKTSS